MNQYSELLKTKISVKCYLDDKEEVTVEVEISRSNTIQELKQIVLEALAKNQGKDIVETDYQLVDKFEIKYEDNLLVIPEIDFSWNRISLLKQPNSLKHRQKDIDYKKKQLEYIKKKIKFLDDELLKWEHTGNPTALSVESQSKSADSESTTIIARSSHAQGSEKKIEDKDPGPKQPAEGELGQAKPRDQDLQAKGSEQQLKNEKLKVQPQRHLPEEEKKDGLGVGSPKLDKSQNQYDSWKVLYLVSEFKLKLSDCEFLLEAAGDNLEEAIKLYHSNIFCESKPGKAEQSPMNAGKDQAVLVKWESSQDKLDIFSNPKVQHLIPQALEFCNGDFEQVQILLQSNIAEIEEMKKLLPCQMKALQYVSDKAEKLSRSALPHLKKRFEKLGINQEYVDVTLKYIRDTAPIIIHFNLGNFLEAFLSDTHYRNGFETRWKESGCQTREMWEDNLFNKAYHKAQPSQRVKYGVLNILNDPRGLKVCQGYGRSFFVLKNVRLRTTFTNSDSGNSMQEVATCQHYAHVLAKYHDKELQAIVNCAIQDSIKFVDIDQMADQSDKIYQYKEAQIHGEIRFDQHIQTMFYDKTEWVGFGKSADSLDKKIEEFRKKFKVETIECEVMQQQMQGKNWRGTFGKPEIYY